MCILIEEGNVNIVNLSVELERAVIQHDLQEDEVIYITEDCFYPFWILVLKKRGFVGFSTHTQFRKSATKLQRLEFCNRINFQYFMVTAYMTDDDKLKIDHVVSYRDGMLQQTFIRGCGEFSRTIEVAMHDLDPENEIVLRPGQIESEPEDAK